VLVAVLLLYLGGKTFLTKTKVTDEKVEKNLPYSHSIFVSSLVMTLMNPLCILMFIAVFSILAPDTGFNVPSIIITVCGVLTGTLLWWSGIVASVAAGRHLVGMRARVWIDTGVAILLSILGIWQVYMSYIAY
jgi:threonine/homoserine/homoserine lactone efflux protein